MRILAIHGVNSKPGSWEAGFERLQDFGELDFAQWPSGTITGDYLRYVLSPQYRLNIYSSLEEKLSQEFDLIVTHSFGQVVLDNTENTTKTLNLGGPFSNPWIGRPLRKYMKKDRSHTYNVLNTADGIPTFFSRKVKIPCKEELVFHRNIFGDDHDVKLYLKQPEVLALIERVLFPRKRDTDDSGRREQEKHRS